MRRRLEGCFAAACILFFGVECASAAPAGSLFVNANPGTAYGNRTFTNVVWGAGYPSVSLQFQTDTGVVFSAAHGGGPAQRIANNGLTPGTLNNDNPAFTDVYTNILRLNALIADTGTVVATYMFSSPMTLVDLIVCDVDDDDAVVVSATGSGGAPMAPPNFILVAEGDLSLTNNAGGRPALEPATPPVWNPETGALVSVVPWNENRTYTILRIPEGVAVETVTITFTGARADGDGPSGGGLGAHVYVNLWASPRPEHVSSEGVAAGPPVWRIPALPGLLHVLETSTNLMDWVAAEIRPGPAAPVAHLLWTNPASPVFTYFRYQRGEP